MTDDRSFMSVGLPTLQHQPAQDASHNNLHVQSEHTDYDQGYSHHAEDDQYKRRSSADLPYSGRSSFVTNRSSSQGYGGQMSVQLPSLNGVFHDPTRSMYVPGPSAGSPGSYGGPSPTDENNVDTFRLPLSASVAASHPHSQFDYHAHHQTDFHQDRHSSHSQASYRDHHPHIPDHSSNPSISPIVPSNPSPGPSYSHSRQHHPHSQMVSSMLYSSHPNEPSSSGFNRSFPQSGSHSYADSHSSTSLSPQLDVSPQLSPVATKVEDRSGPVASSSAARSLPVKRREKPKIELAPDQPLTTQGKPRARVYVACMQCRTRKIRCDGAKPVCHNCSRRQTATTSGNTSGTPSSSNPPSSPTVTSPTSATSSGVDPLGPCCYDAAPKRRGPDKNPGSRQRGSHAQREVEIMAISGSADGGKVRRRRRRDTNAVSPTAAAGSGGAIQGHGASSTRFEHSGPIEKQRSSGLQGDLTVNTNLAGGRNGEIPTNGAAHSPVGAPVPSSSANMGIGIVIGSGSLSDQISGPGSASERVPHSTLHLPPGLSPHEHHQHTIQNISNSNGSGLAGPADLYRAVSGQGHMRGAHELAHSHGFPYSHAADTRMSSERSYPSYGDRHPNLPHGGPQRIYPDPDVPYSSLPMRLHVQVPSQGHQQQQPRPLRTDAPRLISPAQEYPHAHSDHQALIHHSGPSPHPQSDFSQEYTYAPHAYNRQVHQASAVISPVEEQENDNEDTGPGGVLIAGEEKLDIASDPSVQFARETWWDTLLALYHTHTQQSTRDSQLALSQQLTPGLRESLTQHISSDLRFLFRSSNYWFAFINVPRFFARLLDPGQRTSLQPSFILAALACANFIRSSEQEAGQQGRRWSLMLLDRAQASLEASVNSRWIDESLVQASWLIAFFEISAHPLHSPIRVRSALRMLDSLIRSLSMSSLDQADERTSRFGNRSVPVVSATRSTNVYSPTSGHWNASIPSASALLPAVPGLSSAPHHPLDPRTTSPATQTQSPNAAHCGCGTLTLGTNWTHANELTPLWLMTPAWKTDTSDAEIRRDECRRVVWSAVTLVAGYTSFVAATNAIPSLDLYLMEPSNIALLFPGENLVPAVSYPQTSSGESLSKSTVWALYMRTMLLWHSCLRMRGDTNESNASKAEFAVSAWLEVDNIEKALDLHTCGIERAFLFQGREYLFNARMSISYEFQRYIPQVTADANLAFHRKKAEDWLTHQASVAKRTMYGLQTITGQPNVTFARRPFFVFWFMSQVSRALLLWSCDNTLTIALEVSKSLIGPIEYLMSMWPCADQQRRYRELRANIENACIVAGVPPPSPSTATSTRSSLSS